MTFSKGDVRINRTIPGPGRPPDAFRAKMRDLADAEEGLVYLKKILYIGAGTIIDEHVTPEGKTIVSMVVDGDLYLKAREYVTKHGYGQPLQHVTLAGDEERPIQIASPYDTITRRLARLALNGSST